MRLFFSNMHRGWNGQCAAIVLLAEALSSRGHRVVVAGVPGAEMLRRAQHADLETFDRLELRRGFRPRAFLRDQRHLEAYWGDFDPQAILTNGSEDTWACAIARWRLRIDAPLVRWRHSSLPVRAHLANRWLYRRLVDHVAVGSLAIAPIFTDRGLVDPERIAYFPYSARLDAFLNTPRTEQGLRHELGLAPRALLVVSVGRLSYEKGFDVLLRAWKRVVQRHPEAHLAIAGDGMLRADLLAQATSLRLTERVHFLGFRNDIADLYAAADLAVLTPVAGESFGIALLEAFASGLACVATDVGGVHDLVLDGETGFLVPAGDERGIAEAITRCLSDRQLCAELGRRGREHVRREFTPERLADAAEALFERLVVRGGRASSAPIRR